MKITPDLRICDIGVADRGRLDYFRQTHYDSTAFEYVVVILQQDVLYEVQGMKHRHCELMKPEICPIDEASNNVCLFPLVFAIRLLVFI